VHRDYPLDSNLLHLGVFVDHHTRGASLALYPAAQSLLIHLAIPELPGTKEAIGLQARLPLQNNVWLEPARKTWQLPYRQTVVQP
jgi:hypothetical protein